MGFSAKQLKALNRHVDERHIRLRESNGRELAYIEGWYAITQANRIFGFDGWSRETLDSKCVLARENRGSFIAVYTAKVRVTVAANGMIVIREGHGSGEGRGASPGEVHDIALKAAETDATKRALATFGRPFGLELYAKRMQAREARSRDEATERARSAQSSRSGVGFAFTAQAESLASADLEGKRRRTIEPAQGAARRTKSPAEMDASLEAPSRQPNAARDHFEVRQPVSRSDLLNGGEPGVGERSTSDNSLSAERPSSPSTPTRSDVSFTAPKPDPLPSDNASLVPSLPPDDSSPIRRPSRHFGRRKYIAMREGLGALVNEAKQQAETSRAAEPDLTSGARIDKSVLPFGEPKRIRDKAHLRFVASQPCLICGRQPTDAHHLRFAQPRALGLKVSDEFTVPLCRGHHRQLHQTGNEVAWWEDLEINALEIAKGLWEQSHS